MTFIVRPAEAGDVPSMFRIRTSVRENLLTLEELAALGITQRSVVEMLNGPTCAWVALKQGSIVGFSLAILEDACLFAVFVAPEHEGAGIGRALVRQAEDALFADHSTIWLETRRGSRADGFYRRLGWHEAADAGGGDVRLEKLAGNHT